MQSDSDRLLADGSPIQLADGRVLRLKYTMRSLKRLEDVFGTLNKMQQVLSDEDKPKVGPLSEVIAAGLLSEVRDGDELLDFLDPSQMEEYLTAVGHALDQAFPAGGSGKDEQIPSLNGASSTTSPQLPSAEPMNRSGP